MDKVFVYDGPGTSSISVSHSLTSLRTLLHSDYTVTTIQPSELASPQWMKDCALLVMPGGRDIPYLAALQGPANENMKNYIHRVGGSFLGICAGAYYASQRLRWEEGSPIQVVGDRPLGFFPGAAVGCVYKGFSYSSEDGARAINVEQLKDDGTKTILSGIYYNGGGYFEDADSAKMRVQGVRPIARYIDGEGRGKAAAVSCDVGLGRAILWGPHLEFPLDFQPSLGALARTYQVISAEELASAEMERQDLLKHTLSLLGLRVSRENKL